MHTLCFKSNVGVWRWNAPQFQVIVALQILLNVSPLQKRGCRALAVMFIFCCCCFFPLRKACSQRLWICCLQSSRRFATRWLACYLAAALHSQTRRRHCDGAARTAQPPFRNTVGAAIWYPGCQRLPQTPNYWYKDKLASSSFLMSTGSCSVDGLGLMDISSVLKPNIFFRMLSVRSFHPLTCWNEPNVICCWKPI